MLTTQKLSILTDVLGSYRKSGDEYLFYCPWCSHHKPKFSVNIKKNVAKCWTCGKSTNNIFYVIKCFGSASQKQQWANFDGLVLSSKMLDDEMVSILSENDEIHIENEFIEELIELPKEYISLSTIQDNKAKQYILARGLTERDILIYRMGYCRFGDYKERIIIPSFNKSGMCNYFVARSYTGHPKTYDAPKTSAKNVIFNEINIDWKKPIVLVEGIFDAMKAGYNAIPILGTSLKKDSKLFHEIMHHDAKVYIALDSKAEKQQIGIARQLNSFGIETYCIDIKPHKDPGELTHEQFKEYFLKAEICGSDDLVDQLILCE